MAGDNITINPAAATGGPAVRSVDLNGIQTQVVKLDAGGEAAESLVTVANPMPVNDAAGNASLAALVTGPVTTISGAGQSTALLTNATTPGQGATFSPKAALRTFQATGIVTSGTGSVTVNIMVSNDNVAWLPAPGGGTITLTLGTTAATDGFVMNAPWKYVAAEIPASGITGTGAAVTVTMGV